MSSGEIHSYLTLREPEFHILDVTRKHAPHLPSDSAPITLTIGHARDHIHVNTQSNFQHNSSIGPGQTRYVLVGGSPLGGGSPLRVATVGFEGSYIGLESSLTPLQH